MVLCLSTVWENRVFENPGRAVVEPWYRALALRPIVALRRGNSGNGFDQRLPSAEHEIIREAFAKSV